MIFTMSAPKIPGVALYIKQAADNDTGTWKDQVYAAIANLQKQVDACQITPTQAYNTAQGYISDYLNACNSQLNAPGVRMASVCQGFVTQPDAFPARLSALQNGGTSCNAKPAPTPVAAPVQAPAPTPVTVQAPAPVITANPIVRMQPAQSRSIGIANCGCPGMGLGSGGNFALSFGGGDGSPGSGSPVNCSAQQNQSPGLIQTFLNALANALAGDTIEPTTLQPDTGIAQAPGMNVIDFPMADPYSPLTDTGAPIAGMNFWPWGRRTIRRVADTSLPGGVRVSTFNAPGNGNAIAGGTSLSGGFGDDGTGDDPIDIGPIITDETQGVNQMDAISQGLLQAASPPVAGSVGQTLPQGLSLNPPSTLQSILNAAPGIILATGKALNPNSQFINPLTGQLSSQQLAGYVPVGTQGVGATIGSSIGNIGTSLVNFVTQNPLTTLVGAGMVFFLYMEPPSRKR